MLSVLSISPQSQETGVYIDKSVDITFSHEIHNSSLTTANFRIYVMPNWVGQIAITSITKNGPVVTLTHTDLFPASTQLLVWIRGDDNTSDTELKGVASIIGETMDGNYQSVFTTGTTKLADQDIVEDITVSAETLETIDPNVDEVLVDEDDYLDILGTYPNDGYSNISGITNLVFKFDQVISNIDLSGGVVNSISGFINIDAEHLIFGNTVTIPTIDADDVNNSITNKLIDINVDPTEFSDNTRYIVTIFRDKVTGQYERKLKENYSFEFITKLTPLYTSPSKVRRVGGVFIPRNIDDHTLLIYIFDASIWVTQFLKLRDFLTPPFDIRIIEATAYKTVCELAGAITLGNARYIRDEQLADLRIGYDTIRSKDTIDDFCGKASQLLVSIDPSIGPAQSGIKSKNTTKFPNSKRRIHIYPRSLY